MTAIKISALIMLTAGITLFLIPQNLVRPWVKNWTSGYSFSFWTLKVVGLLMAVTGFIGLIMA